MLAAIQLMRAFGIKSCALRISSEYSFTDLGGMDYWVSCWLVVCSVRNGIRTHAGRPHKIRNTAPLSINRAKITPTP